MDLGGFLQRRWDGLVARWHETRSPPNASVPARWLRRPSLSTTDEVCIFVAFAPQGSLSEHSLVHARAWQAAGFKTVVAVVVNDIADFHEHEKLAFADGILVRLNRGYDFGAWAAVINRLEGIRDVALLAITNDSVYGPLTGFAAMLDRARAADADVIGSTESNQVRRHFQSYLLFFKPRALKHPAFVRFWQRVRTLDRTFVIRQYELQLYRRMDKAGLRCLALFPAATEHGINPTIIEWRELVERGFPYLKVQLIRDNPYQSDIDDWPTVLRKNGFDPAIVVDHLDATNSRGALPRQR